MSVSSIAPTKRPAVRHGQERVAVIGGGIMGLAHAFAAARRGRRVLLFERHPRACGASIRNFGMVWPIGQPSGPLHRSALLSRSLWIEVLRDANLWYTPSGSLHLAYRSDELAVLTEFADRADALGFDCQLWTPHDVRRRSPAARHDGLLGGLWSPTELCVDPRQVITHLPAWLHAQYGVEILYDTPVEQIAVPWIVAADGRRWEVDRAVVAAGADFRLLYPDVYKQCGFRLCKLQMLRTLAQPSLWQLGPMIAGGLSLRHYASFGVCDALRPLKERIAQETPELDRFGIHVMASQNGRGEVTLGDSHEYGQEISPFDKSEIDELILRELRLLLQLPDWTIQERWHGVYLQLPGEVQFLREIAPGATAAIASGGCGMTMSFGLADDYWGALDSSQRSATVSVLPGRPS